MNGEPYTVVGVMAGVLPTGCEPNWLYRWRSSPSKSIAVLLAFCHGSSQTRCDARDGPSRDGPGGTRHCNRSSGYQQDVGIAVEELKNDFCRTEPAGRSGC